MPDSQLILAAITAWTQYVNKLAKVWMRVMLLFFVIFVSYVSGRFMYYTLIFSTSPMELPPGAIRWIVGCSLVWAIASSLWASVIWKNFPTLTPSPTLLWALLLMEMMMGLLFLLLWLPVSRMGMPSSDVLLLSAGVVYLMLGVLMWRLDRSGWPVKRLAAVEKLIQRLSRQLVSGR